LDEAVDQVMGRSTDEKGADKAVAIRRGQAKDRARLLQEISAEQKTITQLTEERAPIAAEVRKVEAEVGPIKYIAALLYGDNPDANILEKAVRWVIILLVIVFDPLAIALVLAANASKDWDNEEPVEEEHPADVIIPTEPIVTETIEPVTEKEFDIKDHPYLFKPAGSHTPPGVEPVGPQVYKPEPSDATLEPCYKCGTPLIVAPGIGPFCPNKECDVVDNTLGLEPIEITYIPPKPIVETKHPEIIEDHNTKAFEELDGGYVTYDGKHMHRDVLFNMRPDMLKLVADSARESSTGFGTTFPALAKKGDTFVRVDLLPNKVYKFDGSRWIGINKNQSTSYLYDQEYIKYLVERIEKGEYDIELLSDTEKQQIEEYLTKRD